MGRLTPDKPEEVTTKKGAGLRGKGRRKGKIAQQNLRGGRGNKFRNTGFAR